MPDSHFVNTVATTGLKKFSAPAAQNLPTAAVLFRQHVKKSLIFPTLL